MISFFGVDIRNTTMDEALDWICGRVEARERSLLAFVNPDCLNNAYENEDYRAVLRSADRVLPDGIGSNDSWTLCSTEILIFHPCGPIPFHWRISWMDYGYFE